jgi:hypothetical protein
MCRGQAFTALAPRPQRSIVLTAIGYTDFFGVAVKKLRGSTGHFLKQGNSFCDVIN